jgi:hypothetical protein
MFPSKAERNTPSMIVRRLAPALLAGSLLLAACGKPEISAYRVPKEKDPELPAPANPAAGGNAMANTAVPTSEGHSLVWTAPAHWQAKPATAMRRATFAIAGDGGASTELSVTAFPGDVGGELANLNRWRSQLQMPPVGEAELAAAVTRREHNDLKFGIVDLASGAQRTLGAWVPFEGSTWFFKLGPGPDALVAREKNAFLAFVATIKHAPEHP